MAKGRTTIATAIVKRIGRKHQETVYVPNAKGGFDEAKRTVPAVTRKAFNDNCPPVELFTDVLTDLPALNCSIEVDENDYKAERAKVREVALGIERMEREMNAGMQWLALRADIDDFNERLELVKGRADLDTLDADEAEDAVWLGDEMVMRWRWAIAGAREFNEIRDLIAAGL